MIRLALDTLTARIIPSRTSHLPLVAWGAAPNPNRRMPDVGTNPNSIRFRRDLCDFSYSWVCKGR